VTSIPHRPAAARSAFRPPAALALLMAAGLAHSVSADVFSWNAGNGSYFTPGNWAPNGVPSSGDTVRIGNLPGVQNFTVVLGGQVTQAYGDLEVSSGMTLDLNGTELVSFGTATISGLNSRVIARPQVGGPNLHDFQGELHLGAQSQLQLMDNVSVRFFSGSTSSGTISGRGHMLIGTDDPFRNEGVIRPGNNGGMQVTQGQPLLEAIDLDGNSGNGHLLLDTPFAVLEVNASGLNDPFSGTITMVPGALLTMNMDDGWTADASALITVTGANNPAAASQIMGDQMTLSGVLNVGASQAHLRVLAPAALNPEVNLSPAAWLELDGATTVLDGEYILGQGAKLDFDGSVEVRGGTFETPSNQATDGAVSFNGATTWNGGATIDGVGRQNGSATVSGATVINADVFDMDGAASGVWNINNGLVVNAQFIELPVGNITLENQYNGSIHVAGGFLARLTVNVAAPSIRWTAWDSITLGGDLVLFPTRIAGSPINIMGDLTVSSGKAQISAETYFANGTIVHLVAPSTTLRLNAPSQILPGTEFIGAGTLQNGPEGVMHLYADASLDGVGLTNQGWFNIAAQAGVASVDRFTQTSSGIWAVSIGGPLPGDQYDVLEVTGGTASLDGTIDISLQNLGGGVFAPSVGDQFIILRAPAGVSGAFANDPTTVNAAGTYEWTLLYTPTSVILRLDTFTPTPPCYANCDGSTTAPILNVSDFICFQNKFAGGSPYANCDGSTIEPILNILDFICFQNAYAAGCP
jgi:hypothetical protein